MALRTLSLCAGIGGIDLGLRSIGASRTVCYVERDPFAVGILKSAIARGIIDDAPIWDDVRTFRACDWKGRATCVAAGFPCQPFSTASRGRKVARDLWPDVLRIVRDVEPDFVFLENVQRAPIARAAQQLERFGFTSHFDPFDAAELGAPHRRIRWWLLAHAHDASKSALTLDDEVAGVPTAARVDEWAAGPGDILGMDDGLSHRSHRLRALGNAVVPQVAALAFTTLNQRIEQHREARS